MPKIEPLKDEKIKELLGDALFEKWENMLDLVYGKYDMRWHTANKGNDYEMKIRRGGKTLLSFFPNFPEKIQLV